MKPAGSAAPVRENIDKVLTPGNYQFKFSELIKLEQISHSKILLER